MCKYEFATQILTPMLFFLNNSDIFFIVKYYIYKRVG